MNSLQGYWDPQNTWVFAVGILQWEHPDVYESFPDAIPNRADQRLIDILQTRGVPSEQICYLQDQEATLDNIQENLADMLANVEADQLLILYFTGHGDWDSETGEHFFINYDANPNNRENYWSVTSIFDHIATSFAGAGVLLLADCCFSGGLIDQTKQQELETSIACITSAYSHNVSTGQWTFTEALCRGWSGHASVDLDGDSEISLYDLARYAELEMAFVEEQKSMFLTTGEFDPQMQIAVVETATDDAPERRVAAKWEDGAWYKAKIIGYEDDQIGVRYVDDGIEAWVAEQDVRPYQPEGFAPGESVEVLSESDWYAATVKKFWYGLHFIHYDDYDDIWDEWVSSDRIRAVGS
jgi:hypothetical protein